MPEHPWLQVGVVAAGAVLYGIIWLATRRLPGLAKVLGRALPLLVIVPATIYLGIYLPMQDDDGPSATPRTGTSAAKRGPPPATEAQPRSRDDAPGSPAPQPRSKAEAVEREAQARGAPTPPPPPGEWDLVPVFYGTDRARSDAPKRIAYASDRGRRLELGRAMVTVPRVHQVPKIERPFAVRVPYTQIVLYEQAEDPKLHFTISEIRALSQADFLALVRARIGASFAFKDQAVVFVHGYNTGFDNALYRTAQIAYDLKYDGATFL